MIWSCFYPFGHYYFFSPTAPQPVGLAFVSKTILSITRDVARTCASSSLIFKRTAIWTQESKIENQQFHYIPWSVLGDLGHRFACCLYHMDQHCLCRFMFSGPNMRGIKTPNVQGLCAKVSWHTWITSYWLIKRVQHPECTGKFWDSFGFTGFT